MKEIISNYAVYIIEFLIAYIYFSQIFQKKKTILKIFTLGIVLYLIAGSLYLLKYNLIINTISFTTINILFSYYSYSIKFKSALFHSIILSAVMLISEFVTLFLVSAITNSDLEVFKTNFTIYILDIIFSKTFYLLICLIITRFTSKEDTRHSVKFSITLMIYPICVLLTLLLFRSVTLLLDYDTNLKYNTFISIISFVLLFSVISIFIIYENSIKKENELIELQNELQRKEIDETYLSILEHQNNELQILIHDTKNHLATIKNLSDNNEVNTYVDDIFKDIKKYTVIGNTNNKILDLILSKYQALCEINNINFEFILNNANLNYINNSDLSTLLNNMLDNAVEAAKNSNRRSIYFEIKHVNGIDVLNIVNSCDIKPKVKNYNLITTKDNKNIHGFGTRSIKKIIAKYKGEYDWNYNPEDKTFHSTVIFNTSILNNQDHA